MENHSPIRVNSSYFTSKRYHPRLRILRTLKTIFLNKLNKKDLETHSLGYIKHILRSKKNSILFVSYPSSGWNWVADVLDYSIAKHIIGEYKVEYGEGNTLKQAEKKPFRIFHPADARAQFAEPIHKLLPGIQKDYCYHTHGYFGESPLLNLESSKHVIIVRDFITALYSGYSKRREVYESFEDHLKKTNNIERLIRFYNSWGAIQKKYTDRVLIIKYEDLKDSPTATFENLLKFIFEIDIPQSTIEEAIDYYSFDKQKEREKKFNQNSKKHFHFKGQKSYEKEINKDTYQQIYHILQENLKFKFDYNY